MFKTFVLFFFVFLSEHHALLLKVEKAVMMDQ